MFLHFGLHGFFSGMACKHETDIYNRNWKSVIAKSIVISLRQLLLHYIITVIDSDFFLFDKKKIRIVASSSATE